jgi:integrase-like protein
MSTEVFSPLRQRMIEDMNARKLGAHSQRSHIYSCKRFAAFLKRSPDTARAEDIRRFQLHLAETGMSICNRNRIMTGVRFLFRVTLRRLDLAAEIYHIREPQKIPLVMSPDETRRLLAVASSLKARVAPVWAMAAACAPARSSGSRSSISTAPRRSFASSNRRAARTATSCCRPRCSICCGNGGKCGPRATMPQ